MIFLLPGLARHDLDRRFQVLDAARDVGIALGAPGLPVVLVIHGPHVEAVAREHVHQRIFALARDLQVEHPKRDRRAVHQEQHRQRCLARLRRADALAEHVERDVALLGPVFAAPDFGLGRVRLGGERGADVGDGREPGHEPGADTQARALDDRAPAHRTINMSHGGILLVTVTSRIGAILADVSAKRQVPCAPAAADAGSVLRAGDAGANAAGRGAGIACNGRFILGTPLMLTASDGFRLGAYRADPSGAPQGGVVVVQEIFGVNHHIRAVCDRLAAAGYAAVAPALFDRQQRDFQSGYSPDEVAAARKFVANPDLAAFLRDTQAAVDALKATGPVSVIGFCLGGSVAFLSATRFEGISAGLLLRRHDRKVRRREAEVPDPDAFRRKRRPHPDDRRRGDPRQAARLRHPCLSGRPRLLLRRARQAITSRARRSPGTGRSPGCGAGASRRKRIIAGNDAFARQRAPSRAGRSSGS